MIYYKNGNINITIFDKDGLPQTDIVTSGIRIDNKVVIERKQNLDDILVELFADDNKPQFEGLEYYLRNRTGYNES